jgi:hypothetical protein
MSNLFSKVSSGVSGLMVLNLYIIHWFQCQAKVGSRPFMDFRNIQKKVPPLLRVTVVGKLITILLLFNVYLVIYLNLYPTRAILEVQRFTIAVSIYILLFYFIIILATSSKQGLVLTNICYFTMFLIKDLNNLFWSVKFVCFATFREIKILS